MAKLFRGITAVLAALSLAVPSWAQFRAVEIAPIGGMSVPLTPFSQQGPAVLPLESALTPSLAPSLAPSFVPSVAPNIAPALAVSVPEGRAFFDGAAATPERPADVPPAVAPRGESVSLNGVSLPARVFSDRGSIADQIVKAIDASRVSIDIALHGLALREIAAALVRAKKRGVKVRVIMNQTHVWPEKPRDVRTPEVQQLIDLGFEMKMLRGADQYGVMHNKIAIFDGQILETGSFNWTHAAETWHWENAMFHAEQARVKAYQAYWNWMWSVSSKIGGRAPAPYVPPAENDPNRHPGLPPAPQDPGRPVHFNGELFPGQAFSPLGVTEHLVRAIDLSRKSVDLANFSFTSEALRDALLRAKQRGVEVRIVFDAQQYKYLSEMHWFVDNGFDILLVAGRAGPKGVMHNKFAIFDGALVEAGSFNWTRNGEKNNYENSMFLDAPDDVAGYLAYYERIRSRGWEPGPEDQSEPHHAPEDVNLGH